jgi:hypothetical protein
MFYRRKREGYGQIIETYRDEGKVKQRVILYVGHYKTIEDALFTMPKDVTFLRRQATQRERHAEMIQIHPTASEEAQEECRKVRELAHRLEELRNLVTTTPALRSDQRSAS